MNYSTRPDLLPSKSRVARADRSSRARERDTYKGGDEAKSGTATQTDLAMDKIDCLRAEVKIPRCNWGMPRAQLKCIWK